MLAKIVFEKINFGKQFWIHNIFHIKTIKKQPSILAIKLMDPNNFGYNFGNYEKLFRHFGFGNDHLLREAISANILNYDRRPKSVILQKSKNNYGEQL